MPVSHTPSDATAIHETSFVYLKEVRRVAGGTISTTAVPTNEALISLKAWKSKIDPTKPMTAPQRQVYLRSFFI